MNSETEKNASLAVVGLASVGVLMNLLTLSTSDLLRYDGGALGLTKYRNGNGAEGIGFFGSEDPAIEAGRKAGVFAFIMGILFLSLLTIHNFVARIPCSEILLTIFGAVIQLCLLAVYIAKDNGICEIEGCSWGSGATWLLLSQIIMLSASIGSFYTSGVSLIGIEKKVHSNLKSASTRNDVWIS